MNHRRYAHHLPKQRFSTAHCVLDKTDDKSTLQQQYLPRKPLSMFYPWIISRLPASQASIATETLDVIITTFRRGKQRAFSFSKKLWANLRKGGRKNKTKHTHTVNFFSLLSFCFQLESTDLITFRCFRFVMTLEFITRCPP